MDAIRRVRFHSSAGEKKSGVQVNNGIERLESEVRNVVLEYEVEMERLQKELRSVKESSVTMSKDATEKTEEAQRELLTVLGDLDKKKGEYAETQSRLERAEALVSIARFQVDSASLDLMRIECKPPGRG